MIVPFTTADQTDLTTLPMTTLDQICRMTLSKITGLDHCPTHGDALVLSMSGGGVCLFCNHASIMAAPSLEAPQLAPKVAEGVVPERKLTKLRDTCHRPFGSIQVRRRYRDGELVAQEWSGRRWVPIPGAPTFPNIQAARDWFRVRSNPCVSLAR